MDTRKQILAWIEDEKKDIINFLREFIRIKSPNPPGNTTLAVNFIKSFLDSHIVPCRVVDPKTDMPNIVGTFSGGNEGRHLVLNGHVDVFPIAEDPKAEGWITDPWSGEIINNKIYGRGSTDMKCGTSASIWTYILLNRVKESLKGKLTLTCVSDEETFGPWGSRWLIDNVPEVLGDCCLNGEPSSPFTIRYGEKGLLWITFKVSTPGAHGAYTHLSQSATRIAANLIGELETLENINFQLPESLIEAKIKSESALNKGMGEGASDIVSKLTLNVGTISGGLKNNMVPGSCTFQADFRLPLGVEKGVVLNKIRGIIAKYPNVEMIENMHNPPSHCDPNGEMLKIIQNNVMALRGYCPTPVVSLGGTDARLWRYKNIPAYVYGPFPTGMGSVNENVPIDDFLHVLKTHALSAYDYLTS